MDARVECVYSTTVLAGGVSGLYLWMCRVCSGVCLLVVHVVRNYMTAKVECPLVVFAGSGRAWFPVSARNSFLVDSDREGPRIPYDIVQLLHVRSSTLEGAGGAHWTYRL